MKSKKEIWNAIAEIVQSAGLGLYDLDMPSGANGVLRVFLCNADKHSSAIGIKDCAKVSRLLSADPELDTLLHQYQLEVSSPGVNRRLRTDEHFMGALGERIKIATKDSEGKNRSVSGVLEQVLEDGLQLRLAANENETVQEIFNFRSVQSAAVDFAF